MMTLKVNGREHQVNAEADTPLLYVLREDIKLNAAKFGCGLGQCGACTVIVDGKAVPAFKGSGDITSMSMADGYIEIPATVESIEAGIPVDVTLF